MIMIQFGLIKAFDIIARAAITFLTRFQTWLHITKKFISANCQSQVLLIWSNSEIIPETILVPIQAEVNQVRRRLLINGERGSPLHTCILPFKHLIFPSVFADISQVYEFQQAAAHIWDIFSSCCCVTTECKHTAIYIWVAVNWRFKVICLLV